MSKEPNLWELITGENKPEKIVKKLSDETKSFILSNKKTIFENKEHILFYMHFFANLHEGYI